MIMNESNFKDLDTRVCCVSSEEYERDFFEESNLENQKQQRQRSRQNRRKPLRYVKSPTYKCISISSDKQGSLQKECKDNNKTRAKYQHFPFQKDQILNNRYKMLRVLGEGTFGRVVEASYKGQLYAIKILKSYERSREHGNGEKKILQDITSKDVDDQNGIVKLIQTFMFQGYYCLVFESLGRNLYEVIRTNNYQGYTIQLIQSVFKQILTSIGFIQSLGYTHTDLKPQNMLFSQKEFVGTLRNQQEEQGEMIIQPVSDRIKIIDFGNAVHDKEHHPSIINTRQYRSPEVILGCCPWDNSSDIWSIGCVIIELLTGSVAFPVHQDKEHLHLIERMCGKYPKWMQNRSQRFQGIFSRDGSVSKGKSLINQIKFERMRKIEQQLSKYQQLKQLVHRCLQINPRKRITCQQALKHKFFTLKY